MQAGPEEAFSAAEQELYGSNRIAEGKLPMCASICSTKALVAGDAEEVANVVRHSRRSQRFGEYLGCRNSLSK